jgi:hypothetical protein
MICVNHVKKGVFSQGLYFSVVFCATVLNYFTAVARLAQTYSALKYL